MGRSSSAISRAVQSRKCPARCCASSSARARRRSAMRIIAGRHRGRSLRAPEGRTMRPTGDRAREALFDILAHGRFADRPVFEAARVLDAFAGTGPFGVEALSRGAVQPTFIEKDRDVLAILRGNIAALGEERNTTVLATDALPAPPAAAPVTPAFLAPPIAR